MDAGELPTGCYMTEPYRFEAGFYGTASAENHPARQQNTDCRMKFSQIISNF